MTPDAPPEPVRLPPPAGRALRWSVAAIVVLVGVMQIAVGAQVGRAGPAIGGTILVVLGAIVATGAGRGTVIGRGGIHAPNRLRDRQLPWSTVAALRARPVAKGRVQLLVEREGHPPEAAVRIAVLRPADAERLLPAIAAHAAAHDVPFDGPR
ncbi:hypothetical protein [Nitriliruptor alkaliphilus]|uniref:hypothetical protein n=1 Tax=Nitriliruptor alkaliphilus TaxID=427918 RepID=UPI000695C184|nr:hypothetical protein [Nitriliruptor alkaliphilus]